jgi:hypothetical protein
LGKSVFIALHNLRRERGCLPSPCMQHDIREAFLTLSSTNPFRIDSLIFSELGFFADFFLYISLIWRTCIQQGSDGEATRHQDKCRLRFVHRLYHLHSKGVK